MSYIEKLGQIKETEFRGLHLGYVRRVDVRLGWRKHDVCARKFNGVLTKVCLLQFDLMLSEDGSGRGAALVAAVASKKYR